MPARSNNNTHFQADVVLAPPATAQRSNINYNNNIHGHNRKGKKPAFNANNDSLNELINFSLPPRRSVPAGMQNNGGVRRGTRNRVISTPSTLSQKERFINSAYRFLMKPSATADYTVHFADPDIFFNWADIAQILVPHQSANALLSSTLAVDSTPRPRDEEGHSTCPICLSPPIAPRMTKCGHVFCFACVLHYLQTGEHAGFHRCPICFDTVGESSLKPVKFYDFPTPSDSPSSQHISMRLMARPQLTTLALPRSSNWPSHSSHALLQPHKTPFHFLPDVSAFAKFMLATPASLLKDFEEELSLLTVDKLQRLESGSLGDELGIEFVDVAMVKINDAIEEVRNVMDVSEVREAVATSLRGMELIQRRTEKEKETAAAKAKFAAAIASATSVEGSEDVPDVFNPNAVEEQIQAPTAKAPKPRRNLNPPPPSTQTYYYYQSSSGLPIFLHPLDIRILLSQFGSYEEFPDEIWIKVEGRDEGRVDDDLRKRRCRYLGGLAEGVDVVFLEIDWTPSNPHPAVNKPSSPSIGVEDMVGEGVLTSFEGAIKARRARRRDREKRDDKWSAKVEERERERERREILDVRWVSGRNTANVPLDFGRIRPGEEEVVPAPVIPGAWGARSFASTLSSPATARATPTPREKVDEELAAGIDAAWKELIDARRTSENSTPVGGGRKKKGGNKIVLTINGSGGPAAGRRR